MPYAFPYPYALQIRARSSGGAVVAVFYAGGWYWGVNGSPSAGTAVWPNGLIIAPTVLGPPTYEKIELPREGLDWSNNPLTVGFRPKLHVEWVQLANEVLGQYGVGISNLRSVIWYLTGLGSFLEVALDGWLSSPNFRAVNLVSNYDYENIDGKDIGIKLVLDFEGKTLISAPPTADATSWGTAI